MTTYSFSSEGAECRACKTKIAWGLTFCDACSVTPLEYRKVEALERIAAALERSAKALEWANGR